MVLYVAMYQVLFLYATHQVKAIAIGISEANPLAELVDCSTPLHSTRILPLNSGIILERATPQYPLLCGTKCTELLGAFNGNTL